MFLDYDSVSKVGMAGVNESQWILIQWNQQLRREAKGNNTRCPIQHCDICKESESHDGVHGLVSHRI